MLEALEGKKIALPPILLVALIAAALRLHGLGSDSIWLDEAVSWDQARRPFWDMIWATSRDNYPPLHNIFLYIFIRLFGDSEFALRSLSAVLGIANVLVIYRIGVTFRNRTVGLAAAILMTFSSFHIWYSQETRPYAVLALTSTIFVGALLRFFRDRRWTWNVAAMIAGILLLYSHPYGAFLWASVMAAVAYSAVRSRGLERRFHVYAILIQALSGVAFLPWALVLMSRYHHLAASGFWITRPNVAGVVNILKHLFSEGLVNVAVSLLILRMFSRNLRFKPAWAKIAADLKPHLDTGQFLLLAWLAGPLVLGLIVSLIGQPVLVTRYVICSLPAVHLCLAMLLDGFVENKRPWIFPVLLLVSAVNLFTQTVHHRDDFRDSVTAYKAASAPGDCVILFTGINKAPIGYYLRDPPPCFRSAQAAADIKPWDLASPRVWIFLASTSPELDTSILDTLKAHHWTARELPRYGVRLFLTQPG